MCLITKQSKPEILKEDLTVYKSIIIENVNTVQAGMRYFFYEKNKVYETKILTDEIDITPFDRQVRDAYTDLYSDGEFLSYTNVTNKKLLKKHSLKSFGQGFHSSISADRFDSRFFTVAEFVIPAGSEVYRDETGLIVSNKIMFTGKIIH